MAYRKKEFVAPSMLLHATGQAFVKFYGETYYLGKYGSAAAHKAYTRIIPHLESIWRAKSASVPDPVSTDVALVSEAAFQYLWHLEHDEEGDLLSDGSVSSHFTKAKDALAPLLAAYGDTLIRDFDAEHLKNLRKIMRRGAWAEKRKPWAVSHCNTAITNVRRFFAWCEVEKYVEHGTREHLAALTPLREPPPRERPTVDDKYVDIVCKYTSPTVAAMIRLQRITAARPTEICIMRPCDIDRKKKVWVYSPYKHKTEYKGKERDIPLGSDCQKILAPFLECSGDQDYLFRPADSRQYFWDNRRGKVSPTRKTPVYPSELRRRESQRKQRREKRKIKVTGSPRYDYSTYRQAIKHAINKAKKAKEEVCHWYPYMLRHTRVSEVQDQYGWEDAAAVAGHESINTTKQYAHKRKQRALRIAAKTQKDINHKER